MKSEITGKLGRRRPDLCITMTSEIHEDIRQIIAEQTRKRLEIHFEYPDEIKCITNDQPDGHMYLIKLIGYPGVHLFTVYDQSLYTAIKAEGRLEGRSYLIEYVYISNDQYCYELKELGGGR